MTSNRYLMVNAVQPAPGKEDAYNKWHNNHVSMIFNYQGMKRVNRFHFLKPLGPTGPDSPPYMTVYECESKELFDGLFKSPQMGLAKTDYETNWTGLGEVIWAGNFEPVKTLERKTSAKKTAKSIRRLSVQAPNRGKKKPTWIIIWPTLPGCSNLRAFKESVIAKRSRPRSNPNLNALTT